MILALGFFVNGNLSPIDYREFIRTNSLSHEHLVSAKHFLQREIFKDNMENELMKWYYEFSTLVMNTVQNGNYFDNVHRHENVVHRHTYVSSENETVNEPMNQTDGMGNLDLLISSSKSSDHSNENYNIGAKYLQFMKNVVLPEIEFNQEIIREEIRSKIFRFFH
jgi:hypothetical protein